MSINLLKRMDICIFGNNNNTEAGETCTNIYLNSRGKDHKRPKTRSRMLTQTSKVKNCYCTNTVSTQSTSAISNLLHCKNILIHNGWDNSMNLIDKCLIDIIIYTILLGFHVVWHQKAEKTFSSARSLQQPIHHQ